MTPNTVHTKRHGRLSLLASLILYSSSQLQSATVATASAGGLFTTPPTVTTPGSATWRFSDPTATDNIKWSSGTNHADGQAFNHTIPPETKFTFTGVSPVTIGGYAWKGFSFKDCSSGITSAGSCASTSGTGGSTVTPGRVFSTDTATWTVKASGPLGTGIGASFDATAKGDDPWTVTASDLLGLTDGYSLFFASGLDSASFTSGGSVGFDVMYSTASGSLDLLHVALDANGVSASVPNLSGLSIFSVPSVGVDPSTISGTALSLAQIQGLFQSSLSGGNLVTPVTLGFLLSGLSIPTVDMGDGTFAHVDEIATAFDNGQGTGGGTPVPEPSPLAQFGCGSASVVLSVLLRKRIHRQSSPSTS